MMVPFAVTKHDDGAGIARLAVTGELDQATGEGLATLIGNAIGQPGTAEVVVDLEHVTFLAAAGVRALLHGHAAAERLGCAYRVVNAHGMVQQVLTISEVASLLGDRSLDPEPQ